MAGAFQMLRSNDLIWSRIVHDYLMGKRSAPNDIMAWNADATRMPYRMHSEYLRSLFLNNDLAEGRFKVGGRPWRSETSSSYIRRRHRAGPCCAMALGLQVSPPDRHRITFALTNGDTTRGSSPSRDTCTDISAWPSIAMTSDPSIPIGGWRPTSPRGILVAGVGCMAGPKVWRSDCAAATRWA